MFSCLLGKYLGVELLGQRIGVYLTLQDRDKPFFKVVISFYIPPYLFHSYICMNISVNKRECTVGSWRAQRTKSES